MIDDAVNNRDRMGLGGVDRGRAGKADRLWSTSRAEAQKRRLTVAGGATKCLVRLSFWVGWGCCVWLVGWGWGVVLVRVVDGGCGWVYSVGV